MVKDLDLSVKMMNYVFINTLGVSHASQLRATQLLRSVVKSYTRHVPRERDFSLWT
jgi:hypothetical protein